MSFVPCLNPSTIKTAPLLTNICGVAAGGGAATAGS